MVYFLTICKFKKLSFTHFPIVIVRSTTETSGVGTLKAIPVNLPLKLGMTLPTALAAPVDDGMMFWAAPRPPRQSLLDGPSTCSEET